MNIQLTSIEHGFKQGIKQEVYIGDCYRLKQMEFSRNPQHIVDLGANFGYFSLLASELYPQSKIYAYEMIKRNAEIAEHLVLKGRENIVINHAIAVGKNKIKTIRQDSERNLGGNKVIAEDSRFYLGKKVDAEKDTFSQISAEAFDQLTIEDILVKNNIDYIDYLKVDIEGSEYDVLEYVFENNLSKRILNLSMEVHGRWDHDEKTGRRIEGDSKQYIWLQEQCKKHFDKVDFSRPGYAWLSNNLEK